MLLTEMWQQVSADVLSFEGPFAASSKQQLGARLGINAADVDAYERGDKRISAKLLLAAAKHLKVRPTFFFQGKDAPSGSSVDTPARVLEQLAD